MHPFADGGNHLGRYWKVEAGNGFSANPTVTQLFHYVAADVSPANDDANAPYVAAVFNPNSWTKGGNGATVNPASRTIQFTGLSYLNGEFTSGKSVDFGDVLAYYSRHATNGGNWTSGDTWSTDAANKWAGNAAGSIPTASNPVYIGDETAAHVVAMGGCIQPGSRYCPPGQKCHAGPGHHDGSRLRNLGRQPENYRNWHLAPFLNECRSRISQGRFQCLPGCNGGAFDYYTTGPTSFAVPATSADGLALRTLPT